MLNFACVRSRRCQTAVAPSNGATTVSTARCSATTGTLERARHYRKMCEDPHGGALLAAVGTPGMIHAVEAVTQPRPIFLRPAASFCARLRCPGHLPLLAHSFRRRAVRDRLYRGSATVATLQLGNLVEGRKDDVRTDRRSPNARYENNELLGPVIRVICVGAES